jgi:hypothetical protein
MVVYRLPNLEIGLTVGVNVRQGMLTPTRHLVPPLVFLGVLVSLIFYGGLFHLPELDTDFGCQFFRLPD